MRCLREIRRRTCEATGAWESSWALPQSWPHSTPRSSTDSYDRDVRLAFFFLLTASGLFAQSFEVATIKPTPPDWKGGRYIRMQSAHVLEARNQSVRTLVASAYNVSPLAISGVPDWTVDDRYDIVAKTPGEKHPSLDEQMAMLRTLLTERFQLQFHRETKEMSVYALTVAPKGGTKIKATAISEDATPEGPRTLIFSIRPDGVLLPARYATMGEFAAVLQRGAMNRPVIDQTGLKERYDFDLDWLPDESQFGGLRMQPDPFHPQPDLF